LNWTNVGNCGAGLGKELFLMTYFVGLILTQQLATPSLPPRGEKTIEVVGSQG